LSWSFKPVSLLPGKKSRRRSQKGPGDAFPAPSGIIPLLQIPPKGNQRSLRHPKAIFPLLTPRYRAIFKTKPFVLSSLRGSFCLSHVFLPLADFISVFLYYPKACERTLSAVLFVRKSEDVKIRADICAAPQEWPDKTMRTKNCSPILFENPYV